MQFEASVSYQISEFHPTTMYSDPNNLTNVIKRGMHLITATSGCRMARWVYGNDFDVPVHLNDCHESDVLQLINSTTASQLRSGDTVYVTYRLLQHFIRHVLPNVTTDIVLISSQYLILPRRHRPRQTFVNALLSHSHVAAWFCTDIAYHIPGLENHPKVYSFPYGMIPRRRYDQIESHRDLYALFQKEFVNSLNGNQRDKRKDIFYGYLNLKTNKKGRGSIPRGPKLPYEMYLAEISKAKFVVSPNGDRPECYRHYEALGLGTIPITELNPSSHVHLKGGPVVFANSNWTKDSLAGLTASYPNRTVNRNMVFEEYWMEYVERKLSRSLVWWDICEQKPTILRNLSRRCD